MGIPCNADYEVKGYQRGQLLVHTWHVGEGSMRMEVACWFARFQRGECSRVDVVDRNAFTVATYPPFPEWAQR